MDRFPNELITEICSFLRLADLKAVRLVARAFDGPAAFHLFRKVTLGLPYPERLAWLDDISHNPELCGLVHSFCYDANTLEAITMSCEHDPPAFVCWEHEVRANAESRSEEPHPRIGESFLSCYSPSELKDHHHRFCQRMKEVVDVQLLSDVFGRLPFLRHVEVDCLPTKLTDPFAQETLICPSFPPRGSNPRPPLQAAIASGKRLLTLTMNGTNPDFLREFPRGSMATNPAFLRSLKCLELNVHFEDGRGLELGVCRGLATLIGQTPDLQTLDLSFGESPNSPRGPASLENLLSVRNRWPKLIVLRLRAMITDMDVLLNFLLRHKDTLRSLELMDIRFDDGSVILLVKQLQRLLALEHVSLGGKISNGRDEGWAIERGDGHGPRCLKAQIQDFIIYGGEFPFQLHQLNGKYAFQSWEDYFSCVLFNPPEDYDLTKPTCVHEEYHGDMFVFVEDRSWRYLP